MSIIYYEICISSINLDASCLIFISYSTSLVIFYPDNFLKCAIKQTKYNSDCTSNLFETIIALLHCLSHVYDKDIVLVKLIYFWISLTNSHSLYWLSTNYPHLSKFNVAGCFHRGQCYSIGQEWIDDKRCKHLMCKKDKRLGARIVRREYGTLY